MKIVTINKALLAEFQKDPEVLQKTSRPCVLIIRLKYKGLNRMFAIPMRSNISANTPKDQYFAFNYRGRSRYTFLKTPDTQGMNLQELLWLSSPLWIVSSGLFDQLGGDDSPLAEAILDRIKYDAYKINIVPVDPANNRSMREVYGMDPRLSE